MRKMLCYAVISLFLFTLVIPISKSTLADRDINEDLEKGKESTVIISINNASQNFDLTEALPIDWELSSWKVEGVSRDKVEYEIIEREFKGDLKTLHHWKFENVSNEDITITYELEPGSFQGQIDLILMEPGDFNVESSEYVLESEERELPFYYYSMSLIFFAAISLFAFLLIWNDMKS